MDDRFIIPLVFLGLCGFSDETVVLSAKPTSVIENKTYALICTKSESQAWTAIWFLNGTNVHTVTRTSKGGNDCSSSTAIHVQNTNIPVTGTCIQPGTSFKLTFQSVPAVLNNSRWECSLDDVMSGPFKVNVTEKPKSKISVIPNNGLTTKEVRLTEGEEVNITCSSEPHVSGSLIYKLTIAGRSRTKCLIPQENTNREARATWDVVREYTYITCTVKENDKVLSEGGLRMNILYVPTVLVSIRNGSQLIHQGNITLFCNITANPNVKEVFWRHFMNGRLIREFKKYASESFLSISNISNEDDGDYYCNVTNDISEDYVSNSTKVRIIGSPIILRSFQNIFNPDETDQVIFKITFLKSTTVTNETWLFEGSKLAFEAVQESKKVDFEMIMHNVTVTREGHQATLTLKDLSLNHSGNYSFEICNEFNCAKSDSMALMVSEKIIGKSETSTPTKTYILIIGTLGPLVVVGVSFMAVYRKRRHDSNDTPVGKGDKIEEEKAVTRETQSQSLVMAENPLYETSTVGCEESVECEYMDVKEGKSQRDSELVMQENDLYESSDCH